jgi:serine/threonine protein kinase
MTDRYLPETKVGPFILGDILADSGGMSVVYAARLANNPYQYYALKIARSGGRHKTNFETLLTEEAETLDTLRHPGIVRLMPIRWGEKIFLHARAEELNYYDPPFYFAMELLSGGSLSYHLSRVREFPLQWKLNLVYQIALVIDYIHLRRRAHQDLKPDNIMFKYQPTPDFVPQPILIDFGTAGKGIESSEIEAGTLGYASPERVEHLTKRSPNGYRTTTTAGENRLPNDVWALGVMAYELFSGFHPFEGQRGRKTDLIHNILNEHPPQIDLKQIPIEASEIVQAMLIKVREERANIRQVLRYLDRLLAPRM